MFLGLIFTRRKAACRRCGSVRAERIREGSEPLCGVCEAADALESDYIWIGRCLVRRPAEDE